MILFPSLDLLAALATEETEALLPFLALVFGVEVPAAVESSQPT